MTLDSFAPIVDIGFSLGLIAVGGVFGFLALNMIVTSLRMWMLAWASRTWATTEGHITNAQLRPSGVRTVRFVPHVRYGYAVDGVYHVGNRINFESAQSYTREEAQQILDRYPGSSPVTVYYDPRRPAQSTLEQRHVGVVAGLVMGLLVLATPSALCLLPGVSFFLEALNR